MTLNTEAERAKREDFEQWSISTNQGYDLTRNQTGCMRTYEKDKTEHAWRGFFYGLQAARRAPAAPVPQGWKMVPVEPPQEALYAIGRLVDDPRAFEDSESFWDYLLAAAPQLPDAFQTADGFELWWADHMPSATQSDAWNAWVTLHYYTKSQD